MNFDTYFLRLHLKIFWTGLVWVFFSSIREGVLQCSGYSWGTLGRSDQKRLKSTWPSPMLPISILWRVPFWTLFFLHRKTLQGIVWSAAHLKVASFMAGKTTQAAPDKHNDYWDADNVYDKMTTCLTSWWPWCSSGNLRCFYRKAIFVADFLASKRGYVKHVTSNIKAY